MAVAAWVIMWVLNAGVENPCRTEFPFRRFMDHVEYLGSDELEGRATGSRGAELARHYIEDFLRRNQVPAPMDGSYLQAIPMHASRPLKTSELTLFSPTGDALRQFVFQQDYLLYRGGAQTLIPQPIPLVFVGYGIVAPEFDYNDYHEADVTGKIVVFLDGEPESNDPSYFLGQANTIHAFPESKQRVAISRGARGSILVLGKDSLQRKSWQSWQREFAFEDVRLAYEVSGNLSVVMNAEASQGLFANARMSLAEVFKREDQGMLVSFELDRSIRFRGSFHERDFIDYNVVAWVPGVDEQLRSTALVLSAHYDHLGVGMPMNGDSIYNGVMDNAVGVAALMEIAAAIAVADSGPKRSVVFLFTTGEEKGLLGANYYVQHPLFPLHKTIANINIDGLATNELFGDMFAFGASYSTMSSVVKTVLNACGLEYSEIPPEISQADSFARSDQMAFAHEGVPAVILTEGYQREGKPEDEAFAEWVAWYDQMYHTPFDDLNQPIHAEPCLKNMQVIYTLAMHLTNDHEAPKWYSGSKFALARLLAEAEQR